MENLSESRGLTLPDESEREATRIHIRLHHTSKVPSFAGRFLEKASHRCRSTKSLSG